MPPPIVIPVYEMRPRGSPEALAGRTMPEGNPCHLLRSLSPAWVERPLKT
jgi:hypothetical protein